MKLIKTLMVVIFAFSLLRSPFVGHCYEHLAPQTRFRAAIQQAIGQAREGIKGGRIGEAYGLLAELIEALQTCQATQNIQPFMAKWTEKMEIPPEERVDLHLEDLPAALQEAEALLASVEPVVWEEIARKFPDRSFTEKEKAILLYLYGLGARRMDRVIKRYPATLDHNLNRHIKPIIAYLRSLGVTDLGHVIEENPRFLSRNLDAKLKPTIAYLQSLDVKKLGRVIEDYPFLLSFSLEEKIKPIVTYLDGQKVRKIGRVIEDFPQVLSLSLKDKIKPMVTYIDRQGVKRVGRVIEGYPPVLGLSLEDKLKPTVRYLKRQVGKKIGRLIETFPQVLGYSLEDKLGPTVELLAKIRGDTQIPIIEELQQLLIRNLQVLTLIMEVATEEGKPITTVKEMRRYYVRVDRTLKRQTGQTAAKWVRAQPKDPATQQAIKSRIRPILIGVPPNFAKGRIDHDL